MYKVFKNDQHKVWDNIRALTRQIFQASSQAGLRNIDQEQVERVADTICETIYSLRKEIIEKK